MLVRDFAGELAIAGRTVAEELWKKRSGFADPETAINAGRVAWEGEIRAQIRKAGVAADMVENVVSSAMMGFDIRVRQLRKEKR